jgi:tocopherol O-methyltransferase
LDLGSLLIRNRGEHIHHGYFLGPEDTKEAAQLQLVELLLRRSRLPKDSNVLDVGCGVGGTTRYLAREYGCSVTGITISGKQVKMARNFTAKENGRRKEVGTEEYDILGSGKVRFLELDAEKMGDYFHTTYNKTTFDAVWVSEVMSHLPDKELFFRNAFSVLCSGGKLVIADWFKAEQLSSAEMKADIEPIEGIWLLTSNMGASTNLITDGMLLPPLCTQADYVEFAKQAGFNVFSEPFDISKNVAKTWQVIRVPLLPIMFLEL